MHQLNPKRIIMDYYDSLVRRVDINTEVRLEQYTDEDRLDQVRYSMLAKRKWSSSEDETFGLRWRFKELEDMYGERSSRDPYSSEYDFEPESNSRRFIPGTTTMQDYLNAIRDELIGELRKAEAENLSYYESTIKNEIQQLINEEEKKIEMDDPNTKSEQIERLVELVKEKLFASKYCFLVEIKDELLKAHKQDGFKFASNSTAFGMYLCVCDFYLEKYFPEVLRFVEILIFFLKKISFQSLFS